ncbi:transcriptional regulator CtsR [Natronobacillus azotifigens]|uniref:Transcriptional regulator CtsR n=1 Tax=Natronobacillus azotifigens TaxID=472978 RepID=A0A9J6RDU8_9BACI|nr:CtsR family transcriptional regulator [Natronobacillus azotifigens]MCZ0703508.1 CtsR family transcriptional regulator [Natronobacillus azotifigens]
MHNISDVIEAHLKKVIERNTHNIVEIKRSEIADQFACVPSQINYVINTRFTIERGYLVESKRGGGGYIRITKIMNKDKSELIDEIIELVQPEVTQQTAIAVIERMLEDKLITKREAKIMISVITRETLAFNLPIRDEVRSRVMTAMLTTLKFEV